MTTYTVKSGQSIQTDGIDKASPGDTVEVEAGTFKEEITIDTDGLTLTSNSGAGVTTIDADASINNRAIEVVDGAKNVTIDGFTITLHGTASNGEKYGVRARPKDDGPAPDDLTIKNLIIKDFHTSTKNNRAVGVALDMDPQGSGNGSEATANGIEIRDTVIKNLTCDGKGSKAKGLSVHGKVHGLLVADSEIRGIGDAPNDKPAPDTSSQTGGTHKPRGISLIEDRGSPKKGPKNFEIKRTTIKDIDGDYGQPAIFIGGMSNSLGNNHQIHDCNIFHPVDNLSGVTLDVRNNWWGSNNGPSVVPSDKDRDGGNVVDRGNGSGTNGTMYNYEPVKTNFVAPELRSESGVSDVLFADHHLKNPNSNNPKVDDTSGDGNVTPRDDNELAKLSQEGRLDNLSSSKQDKLDYDDDGKVTFDDIVTKVFERKGLL